MIYSIYPHAYTQNAYQQMFQMFWRWQQSERWKLTGVKKWQCRSNRRLNVSLLEQSKCVCVQTGGGACGPIIYGWNTNETKNADKWNGRCPAVRACEWINRFPLSLPAYIYVYVLWFNQLTETEYGIETENNQENGKKCLTQQRNMLRARYSLIWSHIYLCIHTRARAQRERYAKQTIWNNASLDIRCSARERETEKPRTYNNNTKRMD